MCFALWPTEDTHMHDELWDIDYSGWTGAEWIGRFRVMGIGKTSWRRFT